jgi:hypothetical protein
MYASKWPPVSKIFRRHDVCSETQESVFPQRQHSGISNAFFYECEEIPLCKI